MSDNDNFADHGKMIAASCGNIHEFPETHAGTAAGRVIDVLMRHGISFDGAAGISAGAVFGCNFKSGQIGYTEKNPDELERVYRIGVREAEKRLEDIRRFLARDEKL